MHRPGKLDSAVALSPLRRAGAPEEVASAVMFLCSAGASYMTGANLVVAGGR